MKIYITQSSNSLADSSFQYSLMNFILHYIQSISVLSDSEGLTAQIVIDANDGAQGMIEWQRNR
jgi:hypothetical protein